MTMATRGAMVPIVKMGFLEGLRGSIDSGMSANEEQSLLLRLIDREG